MAKHTELMEPDEFFLTLGALLEERRAVQRAGATIVFHVVEAGAYSVELGGKRIVFAGVAEKADVLVLSNRRTLSDLMMGRFDPARPGDEHLFLWSGDDAAFATLTRVLGGARSWLDARATFQKGGM